MVYRRSSWQLAGDWRNSMGPKVRVNTYGVFILFTAIIFSVISFAAISLSALIVACSAGVAQAQAPPDFVQNLENKIEQENQAGLLTQQQTSKLQKKEGEIRRAIQKGLNKHRGRLTSEEMHSLAKKAKALNRNINEEVSKNNREAAGTLIYQSADQGVSSGQQSGYSNNPNVQPALRGRQFDPNYQPMPPNWQNNTNH